jgi:DNA-directed RNA polymerase subunit E"
MADRLVCRECHRVQQSGEEEACVAHPEDSEIAAEMQVEEPGKYALKVR